MIIEEKWFILVFSIMLLAIGLLTTANYWNYQRATTLLQESKNFYGESKKNLFIAQRIAEESELRSMEIFVKSSENVFRYIICRNPDLSTREIAEIVGSAFRVEDETSQDAFRTLSMADIESDFTKGAVSPAGALGINQLMPDIWATYRKRFGFREDQVFEIYPNMLVSAVFWKDIHRGDVVETAGYYNGGVRWREKPESQQYIKKYLISSRGMDKFRKKGGI